MRFDLARLVLFEGSLDPNPRQEESVMKINRVRRNRNGIATMAIMAIAFVAALLVALLMRATQTFSATFNFTLDAMTQDLQNNNNGPAGPTSDVTSTEPPVLPPPPPDPVTPPLEPTSNTTASAPDDAADVPDTTIDDDTGDNGGPGGDAPVSDRIPQAPAGGGYAFSDNDTITQIFIVDGNGNRTDDITRLLAEKGLDPEAFKRILDGLKPGGQPVTKAELEASGELAKLDPDAPATTPDSAAIPAGGAASP